jgi:transcription-repair coupling factor (superfamily II helicase)
VATLAERLKGRVMVSAGAQPYITVRMNKGQKPVDAMREVLKQSEPTPAEN